MNRNHLMHSALVAALLFLLVGCGSANFASTPTAASQPTYTGELRAAVFDPPRTLVDFSVPATTGDDFTLSEHRGEVILIYFGYRSCPDFCPNTLSQLRLMYHELGEPADKLKVIFATIDPERDTLDYMRQYIANFNDDFIGLRTEGQSLQSLEQEFGVVAEKQIVGDSALSYLYDHTASLFLIGPTGQLEGQYLYGTGYRDIVHDLQIIFQSL